VPRALPARGDRDRAAGSGRRAGPAFCCVLHRLDGSRQAGDDYETGRKHPPTSPSRNAQEKWCGSKCDCTFLKARVDLPSLELASLQSHWEGDAERLLATTRTDAPRERRRSLRRQRIQHGARFYAAGPAADHDCSRHRTTVRRHGRSTQGASAMGGSVATSRRSRGSDGTVYRPRWACDERRAIPRQRQQASGAHQWSARSTTWRYLRGPRNRRYRHGTLRAPHATVGDGCPDVVTKNEAARSSQRGNG
jgi:hypothetical protein